MADAARTPCEQKGRLPYSRLVQFLCPSPGRLFQRLVIESNARTGLDIGCGEHSLLSPLRGPLFRTTGVDSSLERLETARRHNLHDEYIHADFTRMALNRTFDVVVLNNVIEHFPREQGLRVLAAVESMDPRLILIQTPNGFLEQPAGKDDPHQRHLSGWFPHDFEGRGYTVFGIGVKWLRGPWGRARRLPEALVRLVARGLRWYHFRRPHKAFEIAAIRFVDEEGNLRQL